MLRRRAASGRPAFVRRVTPAAVAVAVGLAAATQAAAVSGGPAAKVVLRDVAFHRAVTVIHRGQRVTWTWDDPYVTHNIHAVGKLRFPGASARETGSYTVRFTRSGTYRYVCTLHPGMKGAITVR